MSRTQVNFRFPDTLIAALKEKADSERTSVTELVVSLLERSIRSPQPISIDSELDSRIAEYLSSYVQPLESRIATLELVLEKVSSLLQQKSGSQAVVKAERLPLLKALQSNQEAPKQPSSLEAEISEKSHLQDSVACLAASQQSDQSAPKTEWNVYLHHPRGTVELMAGPFPNKEQAKNQIISLMDFGLFPESKGYQWECKAES